MKKYAFIFFTLALAIISGTGFTNTNVCADKVLVPNTKEAQLYYPCDIASPVAATTMCSGYTATLAMIEFVSEKLTGNGFIVLAFTPIHNRGLVSGWKDGHQAGIAKLKDLNIKHRILKGKINTSKLQVCGYSKGGGGALWAAGELGRTVKSVVALAPYQGVEFGDGDLKGITAATFIQAGGFDDLATPFMTEKQYDALPKGISKAYKRHSAWGHFEWTTFSTSRHDVLINEILAWMKYYLNGDTSMAAHISDKTGVESFDWVK